ncbi:MAG: leucine--tRNA ligase [Candidatus Hodarchaeales archaeon]|jgi:leucyl-tRNA synthetase
MAEKIDLAFLREIEKKWQQEWETEKIFVPEIDHDKPKFFFTIPYPYVSGPLHVGHGRSFGTGDVLARIRRKQGYNVLLAEAFHITGTPVEAISTALKANDKKKFKDMENYVNLHNPDPTKTSDIVKSFIDPWNVVKYFSKTMKNDFKSLGMSFDWTREFTTGDPEYNKFIEWQYKHLWESNYITKGNFGILFCMNPDHGGAVGEDDVASGDELDLTIQEFSLMKFPYEDGFLVASTLRPETVYGSTNVWIHPGKLYVKIQFEHKDEWWVVSKDAVETLNLQNKKFKVVDEFPGKNLIGYRARNIVDDRPLPICPATFVDTDVGSGVVYSVPAHAPFDHIALEDLKSGRMELHGFDLEENIQYLEPIKIITHEKYKTGNPAAEACERYGAKTQDDAEALEEATKEIYSEEFYNGRTNELYGDLEGLPVEEAKERVKEKLTAVNRIDTILIPATKKMNCRCGGKVNVAVLANQFFLDFGNKDWRQKAYKALEYITILPTRYRQSFENTFNWLDKRPCARQRGLGTRFPYSDDYWIIESLSDSTIYMAFYTIKGLINEHGIKAEQLVPEVFDYVYLGKGEVKEITNKSGIPEEILEEMKEQFVYWYPNDHRHTAIMHISNHLSFFIWHHAGIFPQKHWPKKITLFEPVIVEGSKMGKSKGNLIPLKRIATDYSADLFRLYLSNIAQFDTKLDYRETEIKSMGRHLARIFKTFNSLEVEEKEIELEELTFIEKAFLGKITELQKRATSAMDEDELRKYTIEVFFNFIKELNRFIRLIEKSDQKEAVLNHVFRVWVKLASPTIPHTAEELWHRKGQDSFISLETFEPIRDELVFDEELARMTFVDNIVEDIKNIMEAGKIEKIKLLHLTVSPAWKYKIFHEAIADKKDLVKRVMADPDIKKHGKQAVNYATVLIKKGVPMKIANDQNQELTILEAMKKYLEREFEAEIIIDITEESTSPKAKFAEPGRPGIQIETL